VVGRLNVVLFLPEDILLISGSPGERRRYLDVFLCQLDAHYCRTLSAYNRVVSQRNALLRRIREGSARAAELDYWDSQLARMGAYVIARRMWATVGLGEHARGLQAALTGDREVLALRYEHTLNGSAPLEPAWEAVRDPGLAWTGEDPGGAAVQLLRSQFVERLREVQQEEVARGVTILGPHRDDLRFILNGYDARVYGSRGQQRTVALALKLSEVALMQAYVGEMPVLLLDDVLSELDRQRGTFLLERVSAAEQVLITTTTLSEIPSSFLEAAEVWRVRGGTLEPWTGTEPPDAAGQDVA
jgi:DNA replication and repair protein RecF